MDNTSRNLDRYLKLTPYLLLGWVVALACRFAFARDGEAIGAYTTFIFFWIFTAALVGASIGGLKQQKKGEVAQYVLILAAFVSFIASRLTGRGVLTHFLAILFFACTVALVVFYVKRFYRNGERQS